MNESVLIFSFLDCRVKWANPVKIQIDNEHTLYSSPLPGSGDVLGFILNILKDFLPKDPIIKWHRIIEAFKHAYGLRTRLGDIDFVPEIEKVYTQNK